MAPYFRPSLSTTAFVVLSAALAANASLGEKSQADPNVVNAATDRIEFVPTKISAPFLEQFTGDWVNRWSASAATKLDKNEETFAYAGKWSVEEPSVFPGLIGDDGLVAKNEASLHAISAPFESVIDPKGKGLVLQYEVKLQQGLTCGGAYLKLLTDSPNGIQAAEFSNETPYTIMFGPDKCGATNKVHFIFKLKNPLTGEYEERHLKTTPAMRDSKTTTLYTLIINTDNTYEILVDDISVKDGSLFEDFKPAVNPDKEIDDPADIKPSDWIDDPKMVDPSDSKPEDWDEDAPAMIVDESAEKPDDWLEDEPLTIADPDATKPDEWDDEEDGDWIAPPVANPACKSASGYGPWSAPMIKNPSYKGKWYPAQIENPAYKGEWAPRKIANPDYYEIENPYEMNKLGGIGFEIWTMTADILFDNIYVGHSAADAKKLAAETFHLKFPLEKAAAGTKLDVPPEDYVFTGDWKSDPIGYARYKVQELIDDAAYDPVEALKAHYPTVGAMAVALACVTSLLGALFTFLLGSSSPDAAKAMKAKAQKVQRAVADGAKEVVEEIQEGADEVELESERLVAEAKAEGRAAAAAVNGGSTRQRTTRSSVRTVVISDDEE